MSSLIQTLGGPQNFTARLDYLHNSNILYLGNEPSFLPIYLYHYAGRPALSARQIHEYIPAFFNASLGGIPGNDDSGAMGAFVGLAMMGLYPVAGQNIYLITPPFFESVSITNRDTGKTATIRNVNFDPEGKEVFKIGRASCRERVF